MATVAEITTVWLHSLDNLLKLQSHSIAHSDDFKQYQNDQILREYEILADPLYMGSMVPYLVNTLRYPNNRTHYHVWCKLFVSYTRNRDHKLKEYLSDLAASIDMSLHKGFSVYIFNCTLHIGDLRRNLNNIYNEVDFLLDD